MRQTKKADRAMEKIAALLKQHQGLSDDEVEDIKRNVPLSQQAVSRQGEAVLLFLESPAKFTTKECKRCGSPFGTNYRGVGYCSDGCRARSMEEQLGIKWNWMRPDEDRWGGEPPLIIPPAALQKLKEYVEFFASIPHIQTERESPADREYLQSIESELQQVPSAELSESQLSELDSVPYSRSAQPQPETQQQSLEEDFPFDF